MALDLNGQVFGNLEVIRRTENSSHGKAQWLCKCLKCKKLNTYISGNLVNGRSKTCSVCKLTPDLVNKTFGKLTVKRFLKYEQTKFGKQVGVWECLCSCGKKTKALTASLTTGRKTHCNKCIDPELSAYKTLIGKYKHGAKKRNLSFNLLLDECLKLFKDNCYYCNIEPKQKFKSKRLSLDEVLYNGIDRKNNNLGYELQNVVSCCIICNRAKSNLSFSEWEKWLKRIQQWK